MTNLNLKQYDTLAQISDTFKTWASDEKHFTKNEVGIALDNYSPEHIIDKYFTESEAGTKPEVRQVALADAYLKSLADLDTITTESVIGKVVRRKVKEDSDKVLGSIAPYKPFAGYHNKKVVRTHRELGEIVRLLSLPEDNPQKSEIMKKGALNYAPKGWENTIDAITKYDRDLEPFLNHFYGEVQKGLAYAFKQSFMSKEGKLKTGNLGSYASQVIIQIPREDKENPRLKMRESELVSLNAA